MDQSFFNCDYDTLKCFTIQMKNQLQSELDRISEVLLKIPSSGSSNLFLSREMESLNRAMMIRRLTFVCFCSDIEILKNNLPNIQEKIVDMLRIGVGITSTEVQMSLWINHRIDISAA